MPSASRPAPTMVTIIMSPQRDSPYPDDLASTLQTVS
jgi:hypothetical protein